MLVDDGQCKRCATHVDKLIGDQVDDAHRIGHLLLRGKYRYDLIGGQRHEHTLPAVAFATACCWRCWCRVGLLVEDKRLALIVVAGRLVGHSALLEYARGEAERIALLHVQVHVLAEQRVRLDERGASWVGIDQPVGRERHGCELACRDGRRLLECRGREWMWRRQGGRAHRGRLEQQRARRRRRVRRLHDGQFGLR